MLIRPCLRHRPPPIFKNPCHSCRKYASRSINSSIPSQQDQATQRPTIPPKWPTQQPPPDSSASPETPSTDPLQEIISILTTKSATKRNEAMTISAFTPTTAKHFYPQGPEFKPPIGTPWDPDSRLWQRYIKIPLENKALRRYRFLLFAKPPKSTERKTGFWGSGLDRYFLSWQWK